MVDRAREPDVQDDGITVYQAFQPDEFDVPTVAIELVSDREEATRVALVVELPSDLDVGEVGFHPDHRGDEWSVADGRLEFRTTLPAGETVETLYAVDSTRPGQIDALLGNTRLRRVEPVERDGIESETLPNVDLIDGGGVESDDPGRVGPDAADSPSHSSFSSSSSSPDTPREGDGTDTTGEPAGADREGATADAPLSAYSTGELVATLEERTAADGLADEDRRRLRTILSEGADVERLDARVSHLQRRVSDVEASVEPIRRLQDERGNPLAVVDALEDRLRSLSDRLESVDERVASTTADLDGVESRFDAIEKDVQSIRVELATVRDDVERIEAGQETIEADVAELLDWRASARSKLERLDGE